MDKAKPILVYQMGKVGSRSVMGSLEAASDRPVFHIHYLTPSEIASIREGHLAKGLDVPLHVETSHTVRQTYLDPGHACDVITLVREPISRNISAFFQNLAAHGFDHRSPVDEMIRVFKENYPHGQPLSWFQREVEPNLGINVYEHPFAPERGYATYENGPVRLLLLRCETPDEVKEEAIRQFTGIADFRLESQNESSLKRYRHAYASFKEQVEFEPSYLDKLLDSLYVRHFYSADEIAAMRAKWSGSPAVT